MALDMGMTSKAQTIKAKLDKWIHIKPKTFCVSKEDINRVKRQPMEQENSVANRVTNYIFDNLIRS